MAVAPATILAGRYRILKELAHGTIAETFLAVDEKLQRSVVVKVAFHASDEVLDLFAREFKVLAQISDPAFGRVYDYGTLKDGRLYMTREYLEGITLEAVLEHRPTLPTLDALAVAYGLSRGLGTIHHAGFIHRDVKPSNIVIPGAPSVPDFAHAKLIDFGGLGALMTKRISGHQLTRTGEMVGTPLYMSPEQLQAKPQSPATDVYGVALLLARMLYGRVPFEQANDTWFSIMFRILQEDVDLPSLPTVPDSLRALLTRALSREPERRPPDGTAFAAELKLYLDRPVAAPSIPRAAAPAISALPAAPAASLPPAPKSARRPLVIVLAAAAVLFVVYAIASYTVVAGRPPGAPPHIGASWLLIAAGIAVTGAGFALARWLRLKGQSQLHAVDVDVQRLLLGLETRRSLTETLHLEVRTIITKCRSMDERLLGVTILKMIGEYDRATESDHRQAALMNVAVLLEKVRTRLSPWHARFEKQLAFATSLVGVLAGLVTIVSGVMKIARGGQ